MVRIESGDHDRRRRNKEAGNTQGVIPTMYPGIEVRIGNEFKRGPIEKKWLGQEKAGIIGFALLVVGLVKESWGDRRW